jgi:hypothetical protein
MGSHKFISSWGITLLVKQRSRKERWERKKYIGVCSLDSRREIKMMVVFPKIVSKYKIRMTTNRIFCN